MDSLLNRLNSLFKPFHLIGLCILASCSGSLKDISKLTGQGDAGVFDKSMVEVSPENVNFGSVTTGVGNSAIPVGVFNKYLDSIILTEVITEDANLFVVNNDCNKEEKPKEIKSTESCSFELKLIPSKIGKYESTVTLVFNANGDKINYILPVSATVTSLTEALNQNSLTLDQTEYNYGSNVTQIQSGTNSYLLTNGTSEDVYLSAFSGLDGSSFEPGAHSLNLYL
jgi:hypothetical protein